MTIRCPKVSSVSCCPKEPQREPRRSFGGIVLTPQAQDVCLVGGKGRRPDTTGCVMPDRPDCIHCNVLIRTRPLKRSGRREWNFAPRPDAPGSQAPVVAVGCPAQRLGGNDRCGGGASS